MALSFDTNTRDEVCIGIYGTAYASCKADQKTYVDRAGAQALTRLVQYADLFEHDGEDAAPDAWQHWLGREVEFMLVRHGRPEQFQAARAARDEAIEIAFTTLQNYVVDAAAELQTFTLQNVRAFVLNNCIRREPRVWATLQEIDTTIQSVASELWNRANWPFRRKIVRMTIAATGVVTWSQRVDGVTPDPDDWEDLVGDFDQAAVRQWYADSESSATDYNTLFQAAPVLTLAGADEFARLTAEDQDKTGRPRLFRVEGAGSGAKWRFWPIPDDEYEFYGEAMLEGPATTISTAAASTLFDEFPADFRPVLRDAVLARLLLDRGVTAGREMWERIEHRIEEFLPRYQDQGKTDDLQTQRDVLGDIEELGSCGMIGGAI